MPKPLTLNEINRLLAVSVPATPAAEGWTLNEQLIAEVAMQLGIEHPIKFRYTSSRRKHGSVAVRMDANGNYYHRIIVNQWTPRKRINETIWHELCHIVQSEDWAKRSGRPLHRWMKETYYKANGGYGNTYKGNLYEIQAREFAAKKCHIMLLWEGGDTQ